MMLLLQGPWVTVSTNFKGSLPTEEMLVVIDKLFRYYTVESINSMAEAVVIPA